MTTSCKFIICFSHSGIVLPCKIIYTTPSTMTDDANKHVQMIEFPYWEGIDPIYLCFPEIWPLKPTCAIQNSQHSPHACSQWSSNAVCALFQKLYDPGQVREWGCLPSHRENKPQDVFSEQTSLKQSDSKQKVCHQCCDFMNIVPGSTPIIAFRLVQTPFPNSVQEWLLHSPNIQ